MGGVLRLGIVQVAGGGGVLGRIRALLGRGRVEADLIVFPEYLMGDPARLGRGGVASVAEGLDGGWVRFFEGVAREYGSCVVFNMFERASDGLYNTTVFLSSGGDVLAVYRKTHLFDALGYRESSVFRPGSDLPGPVECGGWRVGVSVCFELRFPELFRIHAVRGAELVVVPAAWYRGEGKEEALRVLAQARSHENGYYTAVAALYGESFTGRSMVVNPYGVVEADLGWGERYAEHLLEKRLVEESRRRYPLLRLRRTDIYSRHAGLLAGIFQESHI